MSFHRQYGAFRVAKHVDFLLPQSRIETSPVPLPAGGEGILFPGGEVGKSPDEDHLASALCSKSSFGGSAEWAKLFESAAHLL